MTQIHNQSLAIQIWRKQWCDHTMNNYPMEPFHSAHHYIAYRSLQLIDCTNSAAVNNAQIVTKTAF